MSITEWLANLSIPVVLITIVVLLVIRHILLKQKTPVTKSIAEIAESLAFALGLVFLIIRPFIVQAFFIPSESMVPTLLKHDHILVNKFIYRFTEPKLGDVVVFAAPPEAGGGEERDFIKRVIGVPGDLVRITPGSVTVGNTDYSHEQLRDKLGVPGKDTRVKLIGDAVFVGGVPVKEEEIAAAVGEPNAEVIVVPGAVHINGKAIKEPYIAEDPDRPYPDSDTPRKWVVVDKDDRLAVKIPKGMLLMMGDNRNDSNDSRMWGLLERSRVRGKAMFIFWPLNRIRWLR